MDEFTCVNSSLSFYNHTVITVLINGKDYDVTSSNKTLMITSLMSVVYNLSAQAHICINYTKAVNEFESFVIVLQETFETTNLSNIKGDSAGCRECDGSNISRDCRIEYRGTRYEVLINTTKGLFSMTICFIYGIT